MYRLSDSWDKARFERRKPEAGHLGFSTLRKLNATHLFTVGYPKLSHDESVQLKEIDRIIIGKPLQKPFILYEIRYNDGNARKF